MAQDDKELHNRFGFHPANDVSRPLHEEIRTRSEALAQFYNRVLPDSREKSLALTNLQQAAMWANAAVAINLAPLED